MSYDFEKSSSHRGWADATVITAYPFTIGCYLKPESMADGDTVIALGQGADLAPWCRIAFNGSSQLYGYRKCLSGNNTGSMTVSTTLNTSTWYWCALVAASRYSHRFWVNGTPSTEYTTDMEDWTSGNNLDRIGLACLYRGTGGTSGHQDYFDGKIAEYAVWKSALVQADMDSLAAGALANTVGSNLWGWWRMDSDQSSTLTDSAGSTSITVVGANFSSPPDHPTMSGGGQPASRRLGGVPFATLNRGVW